MSACRDLFCGLVKFITQPSRDTRLILKEIKAMADSIVELRASINAYIANVNKLIEQHKTDVAKIVADAIKADDDGESVELADIKKDVDEANAKLVVPPFKPSDQ